MFTPEQIKAAHSKVKSGADFPRYIADLRELGVRTYKTDLASGKTDYEGEYRPVSDIDMENFQKALKVHQQGGTDYPTFCRQAAEAGVDSWVVDIEAMTCTYYNKEGRPLLVEEISK